MWMTAPGAHPPSPGAVTFALPHFRTLALQFIPSTGPARLPMTICRRAADPGAHLILEKQDADGHAFHAPDRVDLARRRVGPLAERHRARARPLAAVRLLALRGHPLLRDGGGPR